METHWQHFARRSHNLNVRCTDACIQTHGFGEDEGAFEERMVQIMPRKER